MNAKKTVVGKVSGALQVYVTVCDQLCSCLVQLCTDTVQYVHGVYVSSV